MKRPLNIRPQRFCEPVASGNSATQAYIEAGYKVTEKVAGTNGPRMREYAGIKARISGLRASRTKKILSSRDHKRAMLFDKIDNPTVKMQDRLRAMELDAKLAGQFEPIRVEVDSGAKTLLSLKERADQVCSMLARQYVTK